ncbi:hypothetical protein CFC21_015368 [Triticum aestivum]|uniref:Uncharacterized protein n=3 Tax=Triticum TaxID=4564 RepID=A0A9R1NJX8_TRITD|nr:hypothetical protein CFC21_015368 [Triticum aestivum]VAH26321.1 unnamed protein product [Triticum turgidum subsp. durum]
MAAADDDGQIDDDEFYEYNPHPYGGGYDIAATYGAPLPPSTSTCYPVSSPAGAPARPSPRPPAPAPVPAPATPQPAPASPAKPRPAPSPEPARTPPFSPVAVPVPVAEPFYWPKPHDYGDAPRWPPVYPTPEVFRRWPYLAAGSHCCHSRGGPRDYWRQCMRGLDFLFGHADGYGERRIGTDCHGVPVYANKKGGVEDAVVVEVPPPTIGNVQWHDAGEVPATGNAQWHGHAEVPAIGNVQWHDHGEVPAIGNVQWHDAGEAHEQSNWLSSYDNAKEDTYAYAHSTYGSYDASYGQSYSVDAVSDEPTWFPNQSYQDVYREEEPRYQEVLPSYGIESTFSSQPIYCYNQHTGEQSLHVQVEPPETFYSHKLEYHENFSTYTNHIDNSEISTQSCEIQPYAYVPDSPVEAYQPSWSMNLGYYQDSAEEVTPQYDNDAFGSGEYGGMASIFSSSSYPQQVEVYEQSYGDENVSLEQNFQSNWNAFSEDTSGITKSVSIRACIVIIIFCQCYRSNCNAGHLHFSATYFSL